MFTGCSNNIYQIEVSDEDSQKALMIALEQKGKPYKWGGRGPDKFDCSGLITWSYKQSLGRDNIFRVGDDITDDATMNDLYEWNIQFLPLKRIKEGDIVFITNDEERITHGGLFIEWIEEFEEFYFIHSSS